MRDITARRAHEQRLAEQAVTDALTGLPDRSVLLDRLAGHRPRSTGADGCVGVLFVDVDRFKSVNDELGHDAGDQLLDVGRRSACAARCRPTDTVARLGGDEFAVVCERPGGAGRRPRWWPSGSWPPSRPRCRWATTSTGSGVSVGRRPTVTDPAVAPEAVLREADQAMYRAKKAGGRRTANAALRRGR